MENLVFGTGSKESKICILGEAPGHDEVRKGEPFVGKSGTLLTSLMTRTGIMRSRCYITNVIKERPPKNNIKVFIDYDKGRVTPQAQDYIDELRQELSELDCNVIVPAGNVPLWVLTGETGITNWRGSVIESTFIPGKKVIPIIHPASREYLHRHYIEHDLAKIKKESEFPEIRRKERSYILEPSTEEVLHTIEQYDKSDQIGFDIEAHNHEVDCIGLSPNDTEAICIPFEKGGREYFTPTEEKEIWVRIAKLLESDNHRHIAQNAIFDCSFLFNKYGIRINNIEDTMIAQGIMFPDFPKGLSFLCSIYTDMPYYKGDSKFKNPKASDQDHWLYNAKDSVVLPEIFAEQMKELEQFGNYHTYRNQADLINPLTFMMERGVKMDVELKDNKYIETERKLNETMQEIRGIVGYDINPGSTDQLKKYFYVERGLKPITEKGKITTNEIALKKLSAKGIHEANLILRYREYQTMKSRYYGMLLDPDGRLRCMFNPVGTVTGRLSSSKTVITGTGGNMQNQPPDMKRIMQPDEGYIGYEIDLSQAENRIVAYIAPEPAMIEAFESGADIHSRTASGIFGIPEDEIRQKHKEWERIGDPKLCAPIAHGDKTHRYWGKTSNHAFNYDLGDVSFSRKYEIPLQEARFIRNGYHAKYPGVRKMHEMIQGMLREGRTITNLMGRKRLFLDRWGDSLFKEAYAHIPQSTVADIINQHGLIPIYEDRDEIYKPVETLSQIHDSIIFQISREVPLDEHAVILESICEGLEVELTWHGREFVIPAELSAYTKNFKEGYEIGRVTELDHKDILKALISL